MTLAQGFVYSIATLEILAGLTYGLQGNPRLGLVWVFVGLANVAMGGVGG